MLETFCTYFVPVENTNNFIGNKIVQKLKTITWGQEYYSIIAQQCGRVLNVGSFFNIELSTAYT